jgi:hypothetical protein
MTVGEIHERLVAAGAHPMVKTRWMGDETVMGCWFVSGTIFRTLDELVAIVKRAGFLVINSGYQMSNNERPYVRFNEVV